LSDLEKKARQLNWQIYLLRRGLEKKQFSCWAAMDDITGQEMRALETLEREGALMMKSLAGHLSLAANSVTSLVDNLERRGMVRRRRREDDRRVVEVELVDRGRQALEAVMEGELEFCRNMLVLLSEEDQDLFLELAAKMLKGVESK
jgi:DNA-binding MarR family transcriptional regulator